MKLFFSHTWKLFWMTWLIAYASLSTATTSSQKQLKHVKHRMATLQENISEDEQRRAQVNAEIKAADLKIQKLSLAIRRTQIARNQKTARLKQLAIEIAAHQKNIDEQKVLLAKQLQLIYMLGEDHYFKILLDQDNFQETDRMLNYGQYLNAYRLREIRKINVLMEKLKKAQAETREVQAQLKQLAAQQAKEKQTAQRAQRQRQQLIARIKKNIVSKQQRLTQLRADKTRLAHAIHLASRKARTQHYRSFERAKGKLPWPVRGQVTGRFGGPLVQGYLSRMGIVIRAASGAPVTAVAPGTVAYAGWLKGFGLLLIINHGQGYMSLYARNNSLYHSIGDAVQQGDVVATVGQSGGFATPSLYFAIRHNGQALNPSLWLRR